MNNQQQKKIRFGIGTKLSLAIGLVSVIIALLSFWVATNLNKVLTIVTVLNKNWAIADKLTEEIGEENLADLLYNEQKLYDSLSDDEKNNPKDGAYQSLYDSLKTPEYEAVRKRLYQSADVPDIIWADLRFYDEEKGRYVYLMHTDANKDGSYGIGYWEKDSDNTNCSIISTSEDGINEEFVFFPKWLAHLTDVLPKSVSYIPHIIDHLMMISDRHISNRFCILYPIHHSVSEEAIGYLGIGEYYLNYKTFNWTFALAFAAIFIPYFIIITLIARVLVNRTISTPIQQLAKAAESYGQNEDKQANNAHFKEVRVHSHDEVLLLRDSMADMADSLALYMDNLTKMTAKQERFQTEMDMSARIQMGMLPKSLENKGTDRDFTISATIRPAKSVGGDFYDFFEIDDNRIGIVMADVSDKGMPAALFMMIAKLILGTSAMTKTSVVDIMRRTNQKLCDNNPQMLFVTIWFGIYYVKERTIRYVNAGHDYPALYRHSEGKFSLVMDENDFVAGFDPDADFTEREIILNPKDKLFLYTDGVPEAHNPAGDMYGTDRLLAALDKCSDKTQNDFLKAVDEDARSFIGEADQFDDMTMLVMEIN